MPSRKVQARQLREERLAREREAEQASARRRRAGLLAGGLLALSPDGAKTIDLPPQKPGTIEYTCAMGMYGGRIEIT